MSEINISGPLLCIDTSIPTGSVGVVNVDDSGRSVVRTGPNSRAENLFPVIHDLLGECSLKPGDIGGVAVAGGPGSFTGLRIAASTAKTLAWILDKPMFSVGSLLCQARRAAGSGLPVCAAFDAGRGELYAACYRWSDEMAVPEELLAPGAWSPDSLHKLLAEVAEGSKLIFLGQGYLNWRRELDEKFSGRLEPVDDRVHEPDANALGALVLANPDKYLVKNPSVYEPEYLRSGQVALRLNK